MIVPFNKPQGWEHLPMYEKIKIYSKQQIKCTTQQTDVCLDTPVKIIVSQQSSINSSHLVSSASSACFC